MTDETVRLLLIGAVAGILIDQLVTAVIREAVDHFYRNDPRMWTRRKGDKSFVDGVKESLDRLEGRK